MSIWVILIIMGGIVLAGIAIAVMVNKTWENINMTTEYLHQICDDLKKVNEIIENTEELFKEWRNR